MIDPIYEKLPGALNARSMAYPAVKCKEFYDLVTFLFTPEEAATFVAMPLGLATVEEIAENLSMKDLKKLAGQLETMADKGLIHIRDRSGKKLYEALPFVPGITEYQLMRGIVDERHKKIATLLRDYSKAMINTLMSTNPPPMEFHAPGKKVAVDREIEHKSTIVPFKELKDLIMDTEYISVGTCICRHQAALLGKPSDKPVNNCMVLGESAKFAAERGFTTRLTKEEAIKRIEEAEDAGLIHTFANSPDLYSNLLCNCYKDRCMIIKGVSKSPVPSLAVNARWVVQINEDDCTACEACIPRCQMDALKMVEGKLVRDEKRCIGCGICVWTCPADAMTLEQRPAAKIPLKS
ncbi:MAG: 4Fe-4S binding protein [Dehalococcoidia bacterium]|jgi:NAD-dependent dihydropyrimidine dehydrogenase PreA subunit